MKNFPGKEQFVYNGSKELISKLGSTYERTLMQRTSSVVSIDAVLLFSVDKVGIILYNSFHLHSIQAAQLD